MNDDRNVITNLNVSPVNTNNISESDMSIEDEERVAPDTEEQINFRFGLTNARSLWQKRNSLMDYMDELKLSLTIVTETWFYECEALRRLESDALHGRAVSFLHRHRKGKSTTASPGGGVSIAYKRSLITLKEHPVKRNSFEILCAKGKLQNHKTPLFVIAVYLPPKYTAK